MIALGGKGQRGMLPRTVLLHLTSAFRKLGISSRAQLGSQLAASEDDEHARRSPPEAYDHPLRH